MRKVKSLLLSSGGASTASDVKQQAKASKGKAKRGKRVAEAGDTMASASALSIEQSCSKRQKTRHPQATATAAVHSQHEPAASTQPPSAISGKHSEAMDMTGMDTDLCIQTPAPVVRQGCPSSSLVDDIADQPAACKSGSAVQTQSSSGAMDDTTPGNNMGAAATMQPVAAVCMATGLDCTPPDWTLLPSSVHVRASCLGSSSSITAVWLNISDVFRKPGTRFIFDMLPNSLSSAEPQRVCLSGLLKAAGLQASRKDRVVLAESFRFKGRSIRAGLSVDQVLDVCGANKHKDKAQLLVQERTLLQLELSLPGLGYLFEQGDWQVETSFKFGFMCKEWKASCIRWHLQPFANVEAALAVQVYKQRKMETQTGVVDCRHACLCFWTLQMKQVNQHGGKTRSRPWATVYTPASSHCVMTVPVVRMQQGCRSSQSCQLPHCLLMSVTRHNK